MKRNKQSKYRIKIIQELHYKKEQQNLLDKYVNTHSYITYKDMYYTNTYLSLKKFLITIQSSINIIKETFKN